MTVNNRLKQLEGKTQNLVSSRSYLEGLTDEQLDMLIIQKIFQLSYDKKLKEGVGREV